MTVQQFYQKVAKEGLDIDIPETYQLRFTGNRVVNCNPGLMRSVNGNPVLNYEEYLKDNHPELLSEYQQTHRQEQDRRNANFQSMLGGAPS